VTVSGVSSKEENVKIKKPVIDSVTPEDGSTSGNSSNNHKTIVSEYVDCFVLFVRSHRML